MWGSRLVGLTRDKARPKEWQRF
jgi:hypothetical protein